MPLKIIFSLFLSQARQRRLHVHAQYYPKITERNDFGCCLSAANSIVKRVGRMAVDRTRMLDCMHCILYRQRTE